MPSGDALETTELRIGYRIGNGDMSTVPDVADARSGIIDCSVPPCPKRASGEVDNYVFMIDRISDDGDTLFARYSFPDLTCSAPCYPREGDAAKSL